MDTVLPNLFIPGAAKSGTSSLHEYLDQHPAIFMSRNKEPHFFSHENRYQGGLATYSRLFENGRDCAYRGESSTGYMVFPGTVDRIRRVIPHPRFIFILRNPVDRAWSHYRWLRGMGFEQAEFREALLRDMNDEPDPSKSVGVGYKYYLQFGLYAKYLSRYLDAFDRTTIHVITTEALGERPLETVNSCLEFLELQRLQQLIPQKSNRSAELRFGGLYSTVARTTFSPARGGKDSWVRAALPESSRASLGSARRHFMRWLKAKLTSSYSDQPLSSETRHWTAMHYAEDVARLRRITGMAFTEWQTEFPLN
jgi:hypothetical protein